jgi:hypothetical protein
MGTALAAVVTWVLGEGAWDWSSFPVAITLLLVLAAYHRPPAPTASGWNVTAKAAAFAAVAGLAVSLLVAFPVQEWIVEPAVLDSCLRDAGRWLPGDTPALELRVAEDCAAGVTTQWLTAVWVVASLGLFWADRRFLRRLYHRAGAPTPAGAGSTGAR